MTTAFANFFDWSAWADPRAEATTGPAPKPRPGPVFIGDIMMARGGEPELLRRWREDSRPDPD